MKVHICDQCKKMIAENDIKIILTGYEVIHNQTEQRLPKGYKIARPEEFCSFDCLAKWSIRQQELLNDYLNIANAQ